MVPVRHEEHSAIDHMNRMVTLIAAVNRVTESMARARVDRRNRAGKVNVKLRNLFRHEVQNDDMSGICVADQKASRQLDVFTFFMFHVLVFIMLVSVFILILVVGMFVLVVSVFILVVFIFAVTVHVNERDRVYVFRNLEHRIMVSRSIVDQFLQPQPLELQSNCKHEIRIRHASDIASTGLISVRIGSARHQIQYFDSITTNDRNPIANDVTRGDYAQRFGVNHFHFRLGRRRGRLGCCRGWRGCGCRRSGCRSRLRRRRRCGRLR